MFHLYWIERALDYLGIAQLHDLRFCKPWVCQLATRMLLIHAGCMRGCEHRDGCRVSDIVEFTPSHVLFEIAARHSAKKLKLMPSRKVILAVYEHRTSPGAAMRIYYERFFSGATPSTKLFARISQHGELHPTLHSTDRQFIKAIRIVVARCGMPRGGGRPASFPIF